MLAKRCLIRLFKLITSHSKKQFERDMKKDMENAIGIAILRLGHVPYVVNNNRKMAVWSDVKEILLWCPDPHCNIVLNAMKITFGYPESETVLHPCSQLEQLLFLKHFMFITHGTLLIDLDSIKDTAKLAVIYEMVRKTHYISIDRVIQNCTQMLKTLTQKYANTSFKIPLNSHQSKRFLPAVRRVVKSNAVAVSSFDSLTSQDKTLEPCGAPAVGIAECRTESHNRMTEALGVGERGSTCVRTLVPLALLAKLYPGCREFLEQVVQLYVLGRCQEENLHSVCRCTVEEGIQLTRFLASQYGYERHWWCMTSANLMMSWSEFWSGLERMYGAVIVTKSSDVCVVTLNCQSPIEKERGKVRPNWTVPVQLSPPLSTITAITENVKGRWTNPSLHRFSKDTEIDKTSETTRKLVEKQPLAEDSNRHGSAVEERDVVNNVSLTDRGSLIEASVKNGVEEKDASVINEKKIKHTAWKTDSCDASESNDACVERDNGDNHKMIKDGDRIMKEPDKKKQNNSTENRTDRSLEDKKECNSRSGSKRPKMRQNNKKTKINVQDNMNKGSASKGIKERLRGNFKEQTIPVKDDIKVEKTDENNSALNSKLCSKMLKTGSGDTNNPARKQETVDLSSPLGTELQVSNVNRIIEEMPSSEVSQYDLTAMATGNVKSIHVSIKPKIDEGRQYQDEHSPISKDISLVEKPKMSKKRIESNPAVRKTLKMSSAQLTDEIPSNLRCATKLPDKNDKCAKNSEAVTGYPRATSEEETHQTETTDNCFVTYMSPYKILRPKQLELTAPMLRGPDPSVVQESRKIPYKPVKSQELTSNKKQTDNLKQFMMSKNMFPLIEGKRCHTESYMQERRDRRPSAGSSKDSSQGSKPQSHLTCNQTGTSRGEVVENIQDNEDLSVLIWPDNQYEKECLLAEGRSLKAHDRNRDLNSTEFLKERITMWKDQVEQSLYHTSPGRHSKSAGPVRQPSIYNQRPKSSMFWPRTSDNGYGCSTIKTALNAVCSRDLATHKAHDKSNGVFFSPMDAFTAQTEKQNYGGYTDDSVKEEVIQRFQSDASVDSVSLASTPCRRDTTNTNTQYDVQNYGSSSSTTPDIYDVFARKRKPKSSRPDVVHIKPKQVTSPIPTTLSQPVVRAPVQPSVKMSTKPNYHSVGYTSCMKTTDQENQKLIPSDYVQGSKHVYQHINTSQSQNLPYSSMSKVVNSLLHEECLLGSCFSTPAYLDDKRIKADTNERASIGIETENNIYARDLTGGQTFEISKTEHPIVHSSQAMNCISSTSESRQDKCRTVHQSEGRRKHQTQSENLQAEEKWSNTDIRCCVAEKMLSYPETQGKVESLDCVTSIHSILDTNPILSASLENMNLSELTTSSQKHSDEFLVNASSTIVHSTTEQYPRANSASECTKNGKSGGLQEPLLDSTEGHTLSKLNTQLYYKVSGDDRFHQVSENMMIPKHAQFFVQTHLLENGVMVPRAKSVPSIKRMHSLPRDSDRLKGSLSFSGSPSSNYQCKTKSSVVETNFLEIGENIRSESNISEDARLSGTTFDSIIKASEEFIDKSKQIKHIISETKLAIDKALEHEVDSAPENEVQDPDTKKVIESKKEDKDSSKVIIPSLGLIVERKQATPKKTFKEIVEERRAEKRKVQQELAKKTFWNSAYLKKAAQSTTRDVKAITVVNKKQFNKRGVQNNKIVSRNNDENREQQHNNDKTKVKHPERIINSNFEIISQQRQKTSLMKEKAAKGYPGVVSRTKRGSSRKDVDKQRVCSASSSVKHQKVAKPVLNFPRSKSSRGHNQKEADDCTNKILTALRRLSIEKIPKENEQESSRKEARHRKLRSSVVNQISRTTATDTFAKLNEPKTCSSDSVIEDNLGSNESITKNIDNYSNDSSSENDRKEATPVATDVKADAEENRPDQCEDVNKYFTTQQEITSEQANIVYQPPDSQTKLINHKPTDFVETLDTEVKNETFITQYSNKDIGMFTPALTQTSPPAFCLNQERYLSLPCFQESNSNMNNTEFVYSGVICETASGPVYDQLYIPQQEAQIKDKTSRQPIERLNRCKFLVDVGTSSGTHYLPVNTTTSNYLQNEVNECCFKENNNGIGTNDYYKNPRSTNHRSMYRYCSSCAENNLEGHEQGVSDFPRAQRDNLNAQYYEIMPRCSTSIQSNLSETENRKDNKCCLDDAHYLASEIQETVVSRINETHQDREICKSYTTAGMKHNSPHRLQLKSDDKLLGAVNVSAFDEKHLCELDKQEAHDTVEDNVGDQMYHYIYDTVPDLKMQSGLQSTNDLDNSLICKFNMTGGLPCYTSEDMALCTEDVDIQSCEYTASLINEDWDHDYQQNSPYDIYEIRPTQEEVNFQGSTLSSQDSSHCEIFLDETDCGQEVCIGDEQMINENIQDLEMGVSGLCETVFVTDVSPACSKSLQHMEKDKGKTKVTTCWSNEDKSGTVCDRKACAKIADATISEVKGSASETKGNKNTNKEVRAKEKRKKPIKKLNNEIGLTYAHGIYSPSVSEVDAYFDEIKKRTGIIDPSHKCNEDTEAASGVYFDGTLSDEQLREKKGRSVCAITVEGDNCDENGIQGKLLDNDYIKEGVEEDYCYDKFDDIDDENDEDYNPDIDMENRSESDSTDEEPLADGTIAHLRDIANKNKQADSEETCSKERAKSSVKRHGISLDKVRTQFQKKYDIKNSSTLHKLKPKSGNGKAKIDGHTSNKDIHKTEKSIVREFCSKNKECFKIKTNKMTSEKQKCLLETKLRDDDTGIENNLRERFAEIKANTYTEKVSTDSKNVHRCKRNKKSKLNKNVKHDAEENSDDEKKSVSAEGFIKTQKLYYEILKRTSLGVVKEDIHAQILKSGDGPCAKDLSEMIESVPLHGERVISKAVCDAEKALEGTGSLEDIHNDEDDVIVIEDLINRCSYQMIEDEDHVQLGGIAYFKDFTLPFVYLNGYKFTPLKDALLIFTPTCCVSACTIPRSVLQKCKALAKTLSAWEQVYKLELIKMKKGPSIMTGDVLVKLDSLLVQLPELIDKIYELHIGTKLKRSKKCNLSEYRVLKAKLV